MDFIKDFGLNCVPVSVSVAVSEKIGTTPIRSKYIPVQQLKNFNVVDEVSKHLKFGYNIFSDISHFSYSTTGTVPVAIHRIITMESEEDSYITMEVNYMDEVRALVAYADILSRERYFTDMDDIDDMWVINDTVQNSAFYEELGYDDEENNVVLEHQAKIGDENPKPSDIDNLLLKSFDDIVIGKKYLMRLAKYPQFNDDGTSKSLRIMYEFTPAHLDMNSCEIIRVNYLPI